MMKNSKTKNISLAIAFVLGCCVLSTTDVFAQEVDTKTQLAFDLEGITVEARRPDWETKLSPGSVTIIRPDDYKGEQKTLPDLMRKVPGVHVREVNGKGQYTTVTVRGSTAAQVGVFIDGVLSNLGGDAAADLSTIPVANVERIEVYRGYIPARFAGTFIGGVINIVTKKPEKADVSVELGKSSYGGKKGAVEVTAPLGSGSLMFGTSYESSDGDFKYKNYSAEAAIPEYEKAIIASKNEINNFNSNNIEAYRDVLGDDKADNFKNSLSNPNDSSWTDYLQNGFSADYKEHLKNTWNPSPGDLITYGVANNIKEAQALLASGLSNEVKDTLYDAKTQSSLNSINSEGNKTIEGHETTIKENEKKLANAKNPYRWRKYNDYENIHSIIKWQDDSWMVKGSWSTIDRHLPDGLWQKGEVGGAPVFNNVDLEDVYWYDSRRQKIDTKELLLQNRQNVGKLEWGWMVDYTRSEKEYRAEHVYNDAPNPLQAWSKYDSDKYSGQIDGTYKLSNNNMLDFQVNYSRERMNVDGNDLNDHKFENNDDGHQMNNPFQQIRNRYDQELLNVQLQDTITLDDKSTWHLTPSVRYNRSTITGYSNETRFDNVIDKFGWISPKDEQTDSKTTWQLALKKKFDDNFTMRMTGGTYYRLLNMYEIAGDGAAIVPPPSNSTNGAIFPTPEDGKQFDVSALWHGNTLGAYNQTSLTYFWRDSKNMLQLQRYGESYWCYMNDNDAKSHGIELQSSFNWNKFDLDIQATYTKTDSKKRNSSPTSPVDYVDAWATYQPEWEGNVRLNYKAQDNLEIFTEAHYTDSYFTYYSKGEGEASGRPVDDLLVFNTGIKYKPVKNLELAFGCNDVFDQGPKQKIWVKAGNYGQIYINPEFPVQGRTYYVTAKYDF